MQAKKDGQLNGHHIPNSPSSTGSGSSVSSSSDLNDEFRKPRKRNSPRSKDVQNEEYDSGKSFISLAVIIRLSFDLLLGIWFKLIHFSELAVVRKIFLIFHLATSVFLILLPFYFLNF